MKLKTSRDLQMANQTLIEINLRKKMILTKTLVSAINEVDDNLSYKELADSIAFILYEYYGKEDFNDFINILKNKIK
jgi:hypothetical protein|tara:strand:+ start:236 stop:466 length:231 start_codon:yes stop_codon:yes gene_type:complete